MLNGFEKRPVTKKSLLVFLLFSALLLTAACGKTPPQPSAAEDVAEADGVYRIFLITMDQTDQYWTHIDAGCRRAAQELGCVDYKWSAPDAKDSAKQIEMINNAVADGADAILLTAVGMESVNDALLDAYSSGVQVVYVDSPASFSPSIATFCTDNTAAGRLAGQIMLTYLAEQQITQGKIGIVSVNATVASTVAREAGFREAFEDSGFVLLDAQYCDGDFARSKEAASALIADGCVGIYGTNEGSTVGVGNAIRESGSSVIGIGYDDSDNIRELVENGYLKATMVQNPEIMGYEGLKAAVVALAEGAADGAVNDTGVTVLTREAFRQQ